MERDLSRSFEAHKWSVIASEIDCAPFWAFWGYFLTSGKIVRSFGTYLWYNWIEIRYCCSPCFCSAFIVSISDCFGNWNFCVEHKTAAKFCVCDSIKMNEMKLLSRFACICITFVSGDKKCKLHLVHKMKYVCRIYNKYSLELFFTFGPK